jgi:endonuclease-3
MAQMLCDRYGGEVPRSMEALVELPGVARKTANVVLGTIWGIASGIVVDIHVMRLSRLLGLAQQEDPAKIERELMVLVPQDDWVQFSHLLIHHGRQVCIARRPKCPECDLRKLCPSAALEAPPGPASGPKTATDRRERRAEAHQAFSAKTRTTLRPRTRAPAHPRARRP